MEKLSKLDDKTYQTVVDLINKTNFNDEDSVWETLNSIDSRDSNSKHVRNIMAFFVSYPNGDYLSRTIKGLLYDDPEEPITGYKEVKVPLEDFVTIGELNTFIEVCMALGFEMELSAFEHCTTTHHVMILKRRVGGKSDE